MEADGARNLGVIAGGRPRGDEGRALGLLVSFMGATFGAAAIGGTATARSVSTWYRTLRKPDWSPPNWLFGPVWTLLYAMMAVSAWLVARRVQVDRTKAGPGSVALGAWGVQLALNVTWSLVFFGRRQPGAALGVLGALWAAILATAVLSGRVRTLSALLLLPYLAWTTFAGALNYRVWQLNRGRARR